VAGVAVSPCAVRLTERAREAGGKGGRGRGSGAPEEQGREATEERPKSNTHDNSVSVLAPPLLALRGLPEAARAAGLLARCLTGPPPLEKGSQQPQRRTRAQAAERTNTIGHCPSASASPPLPVLRFRCPPAVLSCPVLALVCEGQQQQEQEEQAQEQAGKRQYRGRGGDTSMEGTDVWSALPGFLGSDWGHCSPSALHLRRVDFEGSKCSAQHPNSQSERCANTPEQGAPELTRVVTAHRPVGLALREIVCSLAKSLWTIFNAQLIHISIPSSCVLHTIRSNRVHC
jgi:hypothetical protein